MFISNKLNANFYIAVKLRLHLYPSSDSSKVTIYLENNLGEINPHSLSLKHLVYFWFLALQCKSALNSCMNLFDSQSLSENKMEMQYLIHTRMCKLLKWHAFPTCSPRYASYCCLLPAQTWNQAILNRK